ncbi:MAG TPA: class I SAM-dependent methyltransferase [Lacipirellulaceae bacterium]|nr:class I SAM-dependent methyltransferase [Lacipirellulaceae bacterium]
MTYNKEVTAKAEVRMPLELDMPSLTAGESTFICPETKLPLRALSRQDALAAMGASELGTRTNADPAPTGVTDRLMVRSDNACAYPIVDGIPILLTPEQIMPAARPRSFDLTNPKYAEAYEEMTHYNQVAKAEAAAIRDSESYHVVEPILRLPAEGRGDFPEPKGSWVDCVPDCKAQYEAYRYLSPVRGKRFFQLGGKGIHAVKSLLAGAAEAWVLTPMLGEIYCSIALAEEAGVRDRLRCVVGVAEEIPLVDNMFDAIYSGGCVHHMTTEVAMPEIARVLKRGGRFACTDPWRAPLYAIGTKVLGKREVNVYCRPLTPARVAPLFSNFKTAEKVQYGTLTRYPAIALSKFGINVSLDTMWQLYRMDDAVCSFIPGMRGFGSSVALFATK